MSEADGKWLYGEKYRIVGLPQPAAKQYLTFGWQTSESKTEVRFPIEVFLGDGQWCPVGECGLMGILPVHRTASLLVNIGDARYHNKGIGTSAVHMVRAYAFDVIGLHRISLEVGETNEAAIHVYEKCGFKKEGVLRDARWVKGHWESLICMSILEGEWDG